MSGVFDYIVLGAGSAGCALAARLAESPDVTVLLVEAGGRARNPFIDMPAGNGLIFGNPRYDWRFESEPQEELGGRCIHYPRGRGLGGSTVMNGMIYMRGHASDYDAWRDQGLAGWGYRDVLPYFKRAEGCRHRNSEFHARGGPLRTSVAANHGYLDDLFLEAARQVGLPANPDFNGAEQHGAGRLDVTVSDGRRQSAARAYLQGRKRDNLTVRTGLHVARIQFDGLRANGIIAHDGDRRLSIQAREEVLVCLGAFGSPQCLMLSGIGPAAHLAEAGVKPRVDLPGVGQNLQDHLNVPLQFGCRNERLSLSRYQRFDRALWLALRYFALRSGPGAAPFWSTSAFVSLHQARAPELQVNFTPMAVTEDPQLAATQLLGGQRRNFVSSFLVRSKRALCGFQLDINQMRPDSRGAVRLRSADPRAAPRIDPRCLSEARDRDEFVAGLQRARELVSQPAFDAVRGPELLPGADARTESEILAGVRRIVTTGHHPAGTCKMGRADDPLAVVDAELRVRGCEGLRVVDASVMPDIVSGNLNAPVIMIAEKAADLVLGRTPLPTQPQEQ